MTQRKHLDSIGEIDRIELIATRIRLNAIENITKSKVGHPAGLFPLRIFWPFSISAKPTIPNRACGKTS